ncbi:WXG100 family type VII secretion target [Nocardia sp. alder85J]|uniref:WXG100 family type VII secretion target n=1 Tax=Nocardia sp. alder85J TaxID=2862949 RepID=UPI001CD23AD0|nr:WXG100 family type VII secretion target [Nocardia sp. alder85J]MCX4095811.1 WXG100 family type VII secretion target [Nocardia sp. alder85J]
MAGYSYDLDAMDRFLAQIEAHITALSAKHAAVRRTVDSLDDTFLGEAADAHREAHGEWQQTAAGHIEELEKLRDRVATARRNYTEARAANRAMFGGGGA